MIILSDENVKEIISNVISNKAKAVRYCYQVGDLEQAKKTYEQWKTIAQLCNILEIEYKSISEIENSEFEIKKTKFQMLQELHEKKRKHSKRN